jgi:hypothetical protein
MAARLWCVPALSVVIIVVSLEVTAPFTPAREHLGRGSGFSNRFALMLESR